jgi:beta-lactamase regulating signal transducer with metallopeptidase domain/uncharacterized coiled-coil protein SlyX
MNSIIEHLMSPTAQVITRTLFHSLWQSAGILILLLFVLRLVPAKHSALRYLLSYGSILILVITSCVTFISGWQETQSIHSINTTNVFEFHAEPHKPELPLLDASLSDRVDHWVAALTPYIISVWIVGLVLFVLRLSGSWWLVYSLKKNSHPADDYLIEKIESLKKLLNVTRKVALAESWQVHAPMVIGFFKPMLLLPVGFASGLTTEQVEAIFIHELTHIKREDYLLNLVQSIVEAVFFFNPFDAVIMSGRSALAYVKALAYMEEQRTPQSTLALSAIGTKNQLLHRIKRLMEKSVQQYSWREKLVPLVLLALCISLASWATITRKEMPAPASGTTATLESDTTIKKKTRSATQQRKKNVSVSPDGTPQEQYFETYTGDEDLRGMMMEFNMPTPPDFVMPPIPDIDIMIPPAFDGMFIEMDSLPRVARFDNRQWEQFQAEFQARFQEQFGDFYQKHEAEFEKMMSEMEFDFQHRFKDDWAINLEKMHELQAEHFKMREDQLRLNEDMLKINEEKLKDIEKSMANHATHFEKMNEHMKAFEQKMKSFQSELTEMLRKDGYLGNDEAVRNMHWDDNGQIEINGKEIRKEDVERYRALHVKHFGEKPGQLHFSE